MAQYKANISKVDAKALKKRFSSKPPDNGLAPPAKRLMVEAPKKYEQWSTESILNNCARTD